MSRRIQRREGDSTFAPPRFRVERFGRRSVRYRIWLLADLWHVDVHFAFGEGTVPCLKPESCPYCEDKGRWKNRREGFTAALWRDDAASVWMPVVAAFTPGTVKQIGEPPHRGLMFDLLRTQNGTAPIPTIKKLSVVEPPIPGFDIEPHLLRLWFPSEECLPAASVPDPIPFEPAKTYQPAATKTISFSMLSAEQLAYQAEQFEERGLTNLAAKAREELAAKLKANGPAPKPGVNGVAKKAVPPILSPEDQAEADRIRRAHNKPAEELTSMDAVETGRTFDYVLGNAEFRAKMEESRRLTSEGKYDEARKVAQEAGELLPAVKNGTHKPKGGAK